MAGHSPELARVTQTEGNWRTMKLAALVQPTRVCSFSSMRRWERTIWLDDMLPGTTGQLSGLKLSESNRL